MRRGRHFILPSHLACHACCARCICPKRTGAMTPASSTTHASQCRETSEYRRSTKFRHCDGMTPNGSAAQALSHGKAGRRRTAPRRQRSAVIAIEVFRHPKRRLAKADTPAVPLLAELLPRLERAAVALDDQLRLLQTEADPNLLWRAMPLLQRRVTDLTANATRLRQIALRLLADRDQFQRSLLEEVRDGVATSVGVPTGISL